MLRELRIANLGVIAEATVEFGPGLSVLTGETGAGKTMIVSGLDLICGAPANARLIRKGAQRAIVEATFSKLSDEQIREAVAAGAEFDGDELLMARHLLPARSRSLIGGAQAPTAVVAEIADQLVTRHGQAEQYRLGTSQRQRQVLDEFAGAEHLRLVAEYEQHFGQWRRSRAELAELRETEQQRARQVDMLRFGLAEIDEAAPEPEELTELAAASRRLASADELLQATGLAIAHLAGDDTPGAAPDAMGQVASAISVLSTHDDEELAQICAQLTAANHELADAVSALSRYADGLDADPAELERIGARQAQLQRLTRKYGHSLVEVLEWADKSRAELAQLTHSDERITELESEIENLWQSLTRLATEITRGRAEAAKRLAESVGHELSGLGMPNARLYFELQQLPELGAHGAESVHLLFSANPGAPAGPLGKVASGGELSRVRLALEVTLAGGGETFIFDEVDAGVGGETGLEIGARLAKLAEHSQVIVVTHLAQVAAFADTHYVLDKTTDGEITTTGVTLVTDDQREAELARMMAGLAADSAFSHAKDLLVAAGARRET